MISVRYFYENRYWEAMAGDGRYHGGGIDYADAVWRNDRPTKPRGGMRAFPRNPATKPDATNNMSCSLASTGNTSSVYKYLQLQKLTGKKRVCSILA